MIHGERKKKKKSTSNGPAIGNMDWDKKYEIERDLDALCRAEAVKSDPDRMAICKKLAKEKLDESKRKKEEAQAMIDMGLDA
jgi:hypothetical protein